MVRTMTTLWNLSLTVTAMFSSRPSVAGFEQILGFGAVSSVNTVRLHPCASVFAYMTQP